MSDFQIETNQNIAYTKTGCPHCARAKELLQEHGIDFVERDIMTKPEYITELQALMRDKIEPGGVITTPQIWFMGDYIGGTLMLEAYLSKRENK
jgi:glutathione-dependent peroxiredoxin